MGLFRRRSRWEGVDFLELLPERIVGHTRDDATDGVVLLAPRFDSGLLGRFLQPRLRPERAHIRVKLDARGSWIWSRVDGRRRIAEIVEGFGDAFPEDGEQVEDRVCRFLYEMERERFVRFANLPA